MVALVEALAHSPKATFDRRISSTRPDSPRQALRGVLRSAVVGPHLRLIRDGHFALHLTNSMPFPLRPFGLHQPHLYSSACVILPERLRVARSLILSPLIRVFRGLLIPFRLASTFYIHRASFPPPFLYSFAHQVLDAFHTGVPSEPPHHARITHYLRSLILLRRTTIDSAMPSIVLIPVPTKDLHHIGEHQPRLCKLTPRRFGRSETALTIRMVTPIP